MNTVKNALVEAAVKAALSYLESDPEKNIPRLKIWWLPEVWPRILICGNRWNDWPSVIK